MRPVALALLAALLAGCSAYRLGGQPAQRDIEVRPVRNAAPLAGTHAVLDQALRAALASDARLRVRAGGAPLEAEVLSYQRVSAARRVEDAVLDQTFRVTLTVRCTLRSADGRRTLFRDRDFSASGVLAASGDLAGEESRLLPRLCAEVAAQVRDAAIGAW
jgi:hypothetical protein